jgi:hypothetical protein
MKITEQELKQIVSEAVAKKLTEAGLVKSKTSLREASDAGTSVPDSKKVVAFTKECDDLITEMIEKIKALADKGEELIEPNQLNTPETGTRNELVIQRVGSLRTMANGLSTFFERMRRFS